MDWKPLLVTTTIGWPCGNQAIILFVNLVTTPIMPCSKHGHWFAPWKPRETADGAQDNALLLYLKYRYKEWYWRARAFECKERVSLWCWWEHRYHIGKSSSRPECMDEWDRICDVFSRRHIEAICLFMWTGSRHIFIGASHWGYLSVH